MKSFENQLYEASKMPDTLAVGLDQSLNTQSKKPNWYIEVFLTDSVFLGKSSFSDQSNCLRYHVFSSIKFSSLRSSLGGLRGRFQNQNLTSKTCLVLRVYIEPIELFKSSRISYMPEFPIQFWSSFWVWSGYACRAV